MKGSGLNKSILVVGKSGQLARALGRIGSISGIPVICAGRPEIDLAQISSGKSAVLAAKPAIVINAAAYTAVDKAETEPELAYAINADAVGVLAAICADTGVPLITVSTDYVFDGRKKSPYVESDPTCPINIYGASKVAGEEQVRKRLQQHIILRTSWVYSWEGRNFVLAMADRIAKGAETKVVTDQTGSPTYVEDLADSICSVAATILSGRNGDVWGTYHLTSAGITSWFNVAQEIFSAYERSGVKTPPLSPILSADFPTKAQRPAYSVLDNNLISQRLSITMPDWRDALARCLTRLRETTP
jgi:dTDP-4-dehydrorhamnose reductase